MNLDTFGHWSHTWSHCIRYKISNEASASTNNVEPLFQLLL